MKKSYWPHGIIASIIAIIIACGYTIYYSLDYPVHMDNYFFENYQTADRNYNELQIMQSNFESKYEFSQTPFLHENGRLSELAAMPIDKGRLAYELPALVATEIAFKTDAIIKEAKIILTRPDTNANDTELFYRLGDGVLIVEGINLPQKGRWQLAMRLEAGEKSAAFYKVELFAK